MVPGGLELLIGLSTPPGGVPIAMVAAGGVHEEVLADRVLRTLPLVPGTAEKMVSELRTAPLLYGHRGSPPLDRAAVADCVNRIALLDVIAPRIRELDVNPLVVTEQGLVAIDAKVRVAVPGEPPARRDYVHDRYERALG
jgi:acyl-CoA synthetase (NDP forming)